MRAFSASGSSAPSALARSVSRIAKVPARRRAAVVALGVLYALGALSAPIAVALQLARRGATRQQEFQAAWDGCELFGASLLAAAIALGPLARGERWAFFVLIAATVAIFGGVFLADAITGGASPLDRGFAATGLAVSAVALYLLRPPRRRLV